MSGKYKEVKMTKSLNVNVSADALWEIYGPGFAKAGTWASAVDHSEGHGEGKFDGAVCDTRSCDLSAKGFSSVKERITQYDHANKTLSFDVEEGMPGFVISANNKTVITSAGEGKSKAELTVTMRMKPFMGFLMGGMLKNNLNGLIDSALDDLKVFAETGEPSDLKKARIKKLSSKTA